MNIFDEYRSNELNQHLNGAVDVEEFVCDGCGNRFDKLTSYFDKNFNSEHDLCHECLKIAKQENETE